MKVYKLIMCWKFHRYRIDLVFKCFQEFELFIKLTYKMQNCSVTAKQVTSDELLKSQLINYNRSAEEVDLIVLLARQQYGSYCLPIDLQYSVLVEWWCSRSSWEIASSGQRSASRRSSAGTETSSSASSGRSSSLLRTVPSSELMATHCWELCNKVSWWRLTVENCAIKSVDGDSLWRTEPQVN